MANGLNMFKIGDRVRHQNDIDRNIYDVGTITKIVSNKLISVNWDKDGIQMNFRKLLILEKKLKKSHNHPQTNLFK